MEDTVGLVDYLEVARLTGKRAMVLDAHLRPGTKPPLAALTPVPRFSFDAVLQGQLETDPEGIELANRGVARQEAVRAAAEMAKDRHLGESAKDITLAIREGSEP